MKGAILLGALMLAGCTASAPQIVTRVQVERVQIPAALLVNPKPPAPPKVNSAGAVSEWLARLWADDVNKTGQLAAIRNIQKDAMTQKGKR